METDHQKGERREEPLGFALGAAARKLAKFYVKALADYTLTPSQLFLLRQLWLEDGLPLRDLGLRAQLDATSTTWLVDQLEQAGMVERKRNDPDRRIVRVWLTEAGRQAQAELVPALTRWENALHQGLLPHHTPDEIAASVSAEEAFTKISSVTSWWTPNIKGSAKHLNDVFTMFTERTTVTLQVVEVIPNKKWVWLVTDCHLHWLKDTTEWKNTRIVFEISDGNQQTRIDMTHVGLVPEVECYKVCEPAWNGHLNNLAVWIETGISPLA